MKFKLFRRRLTISAPRMAVRSALPWPFRWAVVAIVLGFCAAIGLWAFEFGKGIAGLDNGAKEELASLRTEVVKLRDRRPRDESGLFIIEGYRELKRALDAGRTIETLFYCPELFLGSNEESLRNQCKAALQRRLQKSIW